jgi:hypothetical protein
MQFVTKNNSLIDLYSTRENKKIANICNTKFLGITLENTLTLKSNIDTIIPKLSLTCFAIKAVRLFLFKESLKMAYYSYFHSIMTYGIIFWGNSYYTKKVLRLQIKKKKLLWGLQIEITVGNNSGN